MTPEAEFIAGVRQLRRFINNRYLLHIFSALVAVTLGLSFLVVAAQKSGWLMWGGLWVYTFSPVAAVMVAWGYHLKIRRSFPRVLIELDERLGLKDLLSTAYGIHDRQKESPFLERLLMDANQQLKQLEPVKIYPRKFSLLHALAAIFTAGLIVAALHDFSDAPVQQAENAGRITAPESHPLRPLKDDATEEWVDTAPEAVTERLQAMAGAVAAGTMRPQEMADTVEAMADETQAHRERAADQLSEALMGHGFPDAVGGDFPSTDKTSGQGMAKQREEIKNFFNGEIPQNVEQALSEMETIEKTLQQLEKTSEEMASGEEMGAGSQSTPQNDMSPEPGKNADPQTSSSVPGDGTPSDASRPMMEKEATSSSGGSGPLNEQTEAKSDSTLDEADGAGGAGVTKAQGREKKPEEIQPAQGPAIHEKGSVSAGPQYQINVRAHTASGNAELEAETVYRTYRQEVESVLTKEEIPLNYRQYIKNYFISIGLRKDDDDDIPQ